MKILGFLIPLAAIFFFSCQPSNQTESAESTSTLDAIEEGVKMIPVKTPSGEFQVFTQRVGDNPSIKVLLLHGGPGMTHQQYANFKDYLPQEGIEFIWYDQLGSAHSDQPSDSTLWTIERFVSEVEQVRVALGLNKDNFYLYGQSWGGMLGIEYALAHQENLKGLIISNMMASLDDYEKYAKEVLGPQMPSEVFEELMEIEKNNDFENPRYMELLGEHHYPYHVLRKPADEWPAEINKMMGEVNPEVYVYMQGYSEFGITPGASLAGWDRKSDLQKITVPTLVIAGTHDTMDPAHLEWMSEQLPNGQFLLCPNGSHLSQYDDPEHFFPGLISFLKEVDKK
ncbi:proline iminopeptidase-family hydrolase [Algoriphagus halophytocola]|uniref:Proline iminopeptidase-family hydrolase n=1 Tax=Algoriphagus halophytocola TaxID=2991499 RepID=A0ABY6MKZ4_9BACT|nr:MULTISPECIES: proline iminopeptidase-family hydrolase [unclassified Algoriphagus]UZD24426.1 proline iminopeptidase-family hydrolase [Algoriphagus sp. TR-M5]WBL41790.1 proline iminopeptidase-family hydrolase [Algoriphagus sp. TR-M9]